MLINIFQRKSIMWVDVHTHLHMLKDPDKAVKTALQSGVQKMMTIGTSSKDWDQVLKDTQKFSVFGALGQHPHEAKDYNDSSEEKLKHGLQNENIKALGEIGLDYYYEHSDRLIQQDVFRRQMAVAEELGLSVEIHTRDAEEDTIKILKEYPKVQGLLHCFTGSYDMAKNALDIGYNISFSGIITFKKADDLRSVCEKVPIDRLHIETDAPYLAPMPHRGKENQPAWILHTAETVARLHKVSIEELKEQTWRNACKLFSF